MPDHNPTSVRKACLSVTRLFGDPQHCSAEVCEPQAKGRLIIVVALPALGIVADSRFGSKVVYCLEKVVA